MSDSKQITEELRGKWRESGKIETTPEMIVEVEVALARHSDCPDLWILKGNMIEMTGDNGPPLDLALESYQKAVEVSSSCGEGYAEIGHYHDVITENLEEAESAFRKSIEISETDDALMGLARVEAQLDRKEEALELLSRIQDKTNEDAKELRDEIEQGIWDPEEDEE